ncbi:hypothetical protein VTK26DRAFT_4583 [Humicola hyalothermophila]
MENSMSLVAGGPEREPGVANKALIPDCPLGEHEAERGQDSDGAPSPGPPANLSGKPKPNPAPKERAGLETAVQVDLDSPGEPEHLHQDIIPPSGLATPHQLQPPQLPQLQAFTGPAYIKPTFLAALPDASGGDCQLPTLALDQPPETMIFSDLYKSPRSPLSKLRHSFPQPAPLPPDFDADLVSKDKTKQKEAVKRFLAEKIRNDWEFTWPPVTCPTPAKQDSRPADAAAVPGPTTDGDAPRDPGEEADSESDAESVYSTISEDPVHFRPRAEWTSDFSDSDEPPIPASPRSPFRFDSPEAVGTAVRTSLETKRARRRRALRDEMKWNPGLACFEARRNAWTGAKTVRVKPKPPSPVSPSSPRRLFWRHHRTQSSASAVIPTSPPAQTSHLQHVTTHSSQHTDGTATSESDSNKSSGMQRKSSHESAPPVLYPVETLVPIPPPLLPPQNPMRASVQPSMYGSLYDKVVVQNLQPSCPVNLSDMLRACVVGWKRDGEWPPRSSYPAPAPAPLTAAELLGMRQRKAQQNRQAQKLQQANAGRKSAGNTTATAPPSSGPNFRRLSFGFLGGGGTSHNGASKPPAPEKQEARRNSKDAGKENGQSHSDEGGAGSGGKTLFRRSLQKVLSLGQNQHQHGQGGDGGNTGVTPLSPTSPTTKEVTAAG